MRISSTVVSGILTLLMIGCASAPPPKTQKHLEASVLWWQTSAELRALQYQAYHWAKLVLERDLKDKKKKGARAVVVDLDETVLDNGPYQAAVVLSDRAFPEQWAEWVATQSAKAIPGSLDFLKYAHEKGVKIFYVTNRDEKYQPATKTNMEALGYPQLTEENFLFARPNWNKEARRSEIRKKYRIVLLVGDNLNDFAPEYEKKEVEPRYAAVEAHRERYGEEFIVLPNPIYGDWEGALYRYDWKKSPEEKEAIRKSFLKGF